MVFYSIFKRRKKNGKGHYWYYSYTDPARNVRVQKRCLGCATKREAYEYIGKLPKQIESGIIFKNYAADYIERYEEQKTVKGYSVKKSSVKTRQTQLNILVSHWGEKKLASITTRDFENWLNHLDKRNATKNLILIVARSLFDFAVKDNIIMKNPLEKIKPFSANFKVKEVLSDSDIKTMFPFDFKKLEEIYGSATLGACFILMLSSGIRRGEAAALRWSDLDFGKNALSITKQWSVTDGVSSPKQNEIRYIIIPSQTTSFLKELKSLKNASDDDLMFDFDGLRVTPERFNKLKRISESMIGKSITPHCLRHTYNSRMRDIFLGSGTGENVLRAFTGHKSEKMTDHYTHKEAQRRINALSGYQADVDKMFGG